MASINDISNEFVRNEIEEYLEQPDERESVIATYAEISAPMQAIGAALLDGQHKTVDELTVKALADGIPALEVMDDGLIAAMRIVGIKFRENFIYVPEVLSCARAMKTGMAHIEPILAASGIKPVGRVVMGTVKSDLHDIGKNLCIMMLRGSGFEVFDLGVDTSADESSSDRYGSGSSGRPRTRNVRRDRARSRGIRPRSARRERRRSRPRRVVGLLMWAYSYEAFPVISALGALMGLGLGVFLYKKTHQKGRGVTVVIFAGFALLFSGLEIKRDYDVAAAAQQAAEQSRLEAEQRMEELRQALPDNYAKGVRLLKEKDYEGALAAFTDVHQVDPNYKDVPALVKQVNEGLEAQKTAQQRQEAKALLAEARKLSGSDECLDWYRGEKNLIDAKKLDPNQKVNRLLNV